MTSPWTRLLRAQTVETLTGDRVNLPADLLHSLVGNDDRHAHPLTFQLVSPHTSLKVYATVREFTADEGTIQLGKPLAESLGLLNLPPTDNDDNKALDVRLTTVTLPCGTYAKLAPLDADYLEIADIRSTLESHLRRNYATLTQGQILAITEIHRSTRQAHEHRFLVAELRAESKDVVDDDDDDSSDEEDRDGMSGMNSKNGKPVHVVKETIPGCLILDQDVVVDIEPLDIGLAEAAVRKKFTPQQAGGGGGGPIQLSWDAEGRTASSLSPYSVKADEYIYFQIPTTPSPSTYTIEVDPHHGDADVFLSTTLEKPSIMDHSAYNVDVGRSVVSLEVPDPTQAPILHIGVLGVSPTSEFQLHVRVDDLSAKTTDEPVPPPPEPTTEPPPGTTRCTNCGAHIPSQTLPMHLAFCLRNNTTCPHCHTTLLKSQAADHWHCGFCPFIGTISSGARDKHMSRIHTPMTCTCGKELFLPDVATHRGERCPDRLHVCRFCHLLLPAGPPSFLPKDLLLGGMSSHESECGARTIVCAKCKAAVQMKDIQTHAKFHVHLTSQSLASLPPPPPLCTNTSCSNPLSTKPTARAAGLCSTCYGTFWSPRHDPQHQRFAQKLVQVLHRQMVEGCGRALCRNHYCATATSHPLDPTTAALTALSLLPHAFIHPPPTTPPPIPPSSPLPPLHLPTPPPHPLYFLCSIVTDPAVQLRRYAADRLAEKGWDLSWGVRALAECAGDEQAAGRWLGEVGAVARRV